MTLTVGDVLTRKDGKTFVVLALSYEPGYPKVQVLLEEKAHS